MIICILFFINGHGITSQTFRCGNSVVYLKLSTVEFVIFLNDIKKPLSPTHKIIKWLLTLT